MNDNLKKSVAQSLDATTGMLPFVPELIKDMWALGSFPDRIVELLKPLDLTPEKTRVLDLGCGKGAVSITLAQELDFWAVGIDACRPFLEEAKSKAEEHQVSNLCRFEYGDIRKAVQTLKDFDVVIYVSLGGTLGGFDATVGKLRQTVRPGGYLIIDDGFLKESTKLDRAGYEHYAPHDETLKQLTSHGDTLLREIIYTFEETQNLDHHYLDLIRKRGKIFIKNHPELADDVLAYIENQEEECEIIDQHIVGAMWLLQRLDTPIQEK